MIGQFIQPSGGGSSALKPTDDIQTALNAASAGDVITLGPGTWDLGTGYLEIPNNVHLQGAGMELTIIQSNMDSASAPFHGIVAPGDNSLIQDVAIVCTRTDNGQTNALGRRTGSTKTHTNVTYRRCHLRGGNDCIYSNGLTLGDITFFDCLLEGSNDIVMWQCAGNAVFINCEMRHTTQATAPNASFTAMYDGGFGPGVNLQAYGCRFTLRGAAASITGSYLIEAGTHIEVYNCTIDYGTGNTLTSCFDASADADGALITKGLRRIDGQPVKYATFGAPILADDVYQNTVAHLPNTPVVGQIAVVTDGAAALAWGATVTGAGSTKYLVVWNGTAWTVIGK